MASSTKWRYVTWTPIAKPMSGKATPNRRGRSFHFFSAIVTYIEAMDIIVPQTLLSIVFILINVPLNYLFIYSIHMPDTEDGLGFRGAAWASGVSHILQLLAIWIYIWRPHRGGKFRLQEVQDTWDGWSMECLSLRRAWIFFRIGVPQGCLCLLDDWIFQVIITVVAGTLGTVQVAAVGVLNTFLIGIGPCLHSFCQAMSIRISTRLNNDRPQQGLPAQRSYMVGFGLMMVVALVVAVLVECLQNEIAGIFSQDPKVDAVVRDMAPVAALWFFVQSVGFCHSGVLDALGQSLVTNIASGVCNWVLGMSLLALLLCTSDDVKKDGPVALWTSLTVGEVVKGVTLFVWVHFNVDWAEEVNFAERRSLEMDAEFKARQNEVDGVTDEMKPISTEHVGSAAGYGAMAGTEDVGAASGASQSSWYTFGLFGEGPGRTEAQLDGQNKPDL